MTDSDNTIDENIKDTTQNNTEHQKTDVPLQKVKKEKGKNTNKAGRDRTSIKRMIFHLTCVV